MPYEVDPTLVRGLDYYTRTVFEFTSDALGAQSGVGGGGRYDGLVEQLGGPPTPGVGWAAGIERMLLAAEGRPAPEPVVDLYVAYDDAGAARPGLRHRRRGTAAGLGAPSSSSPGARSRASCKQAGRLGAAFVAILREDGMELKDSQTGEQEPVDGPTAVVARVLRGTGWAPGL